MASEFRRAKALWPACDPPPRALPFSASAEKQAPAGHQHNPMKTIKTTWTGIRPLISHNGLLVDPLNPFTRQIKAITSKGSKKLTDADHAQRDRLEWEGGLYYDEAAKRPYIPSDNLESCIRAGARKQRLGKNVEAAVLVSDDIVHVEYQGPKDREKMYADPRFTLRKGIVVPATGNRLIRIRPMLPVGWKLSFTLEYDETVVNEESLIKAMQDAGSLIGLGDHRPKFGRFLVEV